jgi:hypothetical protein
MVIDTAFLSERVSIAHFAKLLDQIGNYLSHKFIVAIILGKPYGNIYPTNRDIFLKDFMKYLIIGKL